MSSIYDENIDVEELNEEQEEIHIENNQENIVNEKKNNKKNGVKNNKKKGKMGDEKKRKIKKAIKNHIANLSVDMFAARHKKEGVKARALALTIKRLRAQAKSL